VGVVQRLYQRACRHQDQAQAKEGKEEAGKARKARGEEMTKAKDLADKIDLHLQVNSPGFHLSDDDMRLIAASLRGGELPQSPRVSDLETPPELLALIDRAKNHVMSAEEIYEQRRSFIRGMCPSNRDYKGWCEAVDKMYPPLSVTRPDRKSEQ
jgi:hypothetical protein